MLQNGKVLSKDFFEKTIVLQTLLTWQQLAKIGKTVFFFSNFSVQCDYVQVRCDMSQKDRF